VFGSNAGTIGVFLKTSTEGKQLRQVGNSAAFEQERMLLVCMLKCQRNAFSKVKQQTINLIKPI
jgi:trans-2-enoyl-CoA reductase